MMGGKCDICEKDGADRVYRSETVHSTCILNTYKLKFGFFEFKTDRRWRRLKFKTMIFHPIWYFIIRPRTDYDDDSR